MSGGTNLPTSSATSKLVVEPVKVAVPPTKDPKATAKDNILEKFIIFLSSEISWIVGDFKLFDVVDGSHSFLSETLTSMMLSGNVIIIIIILLLLLLLVLIK